MVQEGKAWAFVKYLIPSFETDYRLPTTDLLNGVPRTQEGAFGQRISLNCLGSFATKRSIESPIRTLFFDHKAAFALMSVLNNNRSTNLFC